MSSPQAKPRRWNRAGRWILPAALLALTPKCGLCLLAYAGMSAALGLGGAEFCSASPDTSVSGLTAFAWLGFAGVVSALGFSASSRRGAARRATRQASSRSTL